MVSGMVKCQDWLSGWKVDDFSECSIHPINIKLQICLFLSCFLWDVCWWVVHELHLRDSIHVCMIHAKCWLTHMRALHNFKVDEMRKVYFQYFFSIPLIIFILSSDPCEAIAFCRINLWIYRQTDRQTK